MNVDRFKRSNLKGDAVTTSGMIARWIACTMSDRCELATGRVRPVGEPADRTCILRTRWPRHTRERLKGTQKFSCHTNVRLSFSYRKPLTMHENCVKRDGC